MILSLLFIFFFLPLFYSGFFRHHYILGTVSRSDDTGREPSFRCNGMLCSPCHRRRRGSPAQHKAHEMRTPFLERHGTSVTSLSFVRRRPAIVGHLKKINNDTMINVTVDLCKPEPIWVNTSFTPRVSSRSPTAFSKVTQRYVFESIVNCSPNFWNFSIAVHSFNCSLSFGNEK